MKIGYVRVSKQEQHEALQIDALKEAGCEKWFLDKITGSKAEHKGLTERLFHLDHHLSRLFTSFKYTNIFGLLLLLSWLIWHNGLEPKHYTFNRRRQRVNIIG